MSVIYASRLRDVLQSIQAYYYPVWQTSQAEKSAG